MCLLCSSCHLDIQGLHTAGTNAMLYRNKRHNRDIISGDAPTPKPCLHRAAVTQSQAVSAPRQQAGLVVATATGPGVAPTTYSYGIRDEPDCPCRNWNRKARCIGQYCSTQDWPACPCVGAFPAPAACLPLGYVVHQPHVGTAAHAQTICACPNYLRMQGIAA